MFPKREEALEILREEEIMKLNLKDKKIINTACSLGYIILTYLFKFYYQLEYVAFEVDNSRAIIFLILNTIFVGTTLYFLKLSKSKIAILIVAIFSIISLKVYAMGPMQIIMNNKFNDMFPKESILTLTFILVIIILILNMAVSFYSIFKLHELEEYKELKKDLNKI